MRTLILLAFPVLLTPAWSQDSLLTLLNTAFDGRVRFAIDGEQLIVDQYRGEEHIRQDVVYLEELDTASVAYVEEESAVVVKCLVQQEGCIEKEIFKTGKIAPTNRMTFSMPADDDRRAGVLTALRELINGEAERRLSEGRETKGRPRRKN